MTAIYIQETEIEKDTKVTERERETYVIPPVSTLIKKVSNNAKCLNNKISIYSHVNSFHHIHNISWPVGCPTVCIPWQIGCPKIFI